MRKFTTFAFQIRLAKVAGIVGCGWLVGGVGLFIWMVSLRTISCRTELDYHMVYL